MKQNKERSGIDTNTFKNHFEVLNDKGQSVRNRDVVIDLNIQATLEGYDFDEQITVEEVVSQIKKLKNNKAPGVDLIVN